MVHRISSLLGSRPLRSLHSRGVFFPFHIVSCFRHGILHCPIRKGLFVSDDRHLRTCHHSFLHQHIHSGGTVLPHPKDRKSGAHSQPTRGAEMDRFRPRGRLQNGVQISLSFPFSHRTIISSSSDDIGRMVGGVLLFQSRSRIQIGIFGTVEVAGSKGANHRDTSLEGGEEFPQHAVSFASCVPRVRRLSKLDVILVSLNSKGTALRIRAALCLKCAG